MIAMVRMAQPARLASSLLLVRHVRSTAQRRVLLATSGLTAAAAAASSSQQRSSSTTTTTFCAPAIPDDWLEYDHYNGVTILLSEGDDDNNNNDNDNNNNNNNDLLQSPSDFGAALAQSLEAWKAEGRKGIWLHVPPRHADKIAAAMDLGFSFHLVQPNHPQQSSSKDNNINNNNNNILILTLWLPTLDDPTAVSRLPVGPTHQVGVGCYVPHPTDPSLMLVVQEKTGPAAAWQLWKMPTGLTDPGEDLHSAAVRELWEETRLTATCRGLLEFRQAHPTQLVVGDNNNDNNNNKPRRRVYRTHSDLFFVCVMDLVRPNNNNTADHDDWANNLVMQACPDEIAAIQWMKVDDYCRQDRWQSSPVYLEMNRVLQNAAEHQTSLLRPHVLELGFGRGTNALYHATELPPQSQL